MQDGQYRLSGGFPGSRGPISGQISYFRPLYNKISIFEKSRFFRFFDDFRDFSDLIGGRNRPEVAGHMKNFQKCILWTLQKCFHAYKTYIACLDRILWPFEVCSFLAIFIDFQLCGLFKGILVQNRKSMKMAKNEQTSNGHKIRSKHAI